MIGRRLKIRFIGKYQRYLNLILVHFLKRNRITNGGILWFVKIKRLSKSEVQQYHEEGWIVPFKLISPTNISINQRVWADNAPLNVLIIPSHFILPSMFYLPQLKTTGFNGRTSSSNPFRESGCKGGNGCRTVSDWITPPSSMAALVARRPH